MLGTYNYTCVLFALQMHICGCNNAVMQPIMHGCIPNIPVVTLHAVWRNTCNTIHCRCLSSRPYWKRCSGIALYIIGFK